MAVARASLSGAHDGLIVGIGPVIIAAVGPDFLTILMHADVCRSQPSRRRHPHFIPATNGRNDNVDSNAFVLCLKK